MECDAGPSTSQASRGHRPPEEAATAQSEQTSGIHTQHILVYPKELEFCKVYEQKNVCKDIRMLLEFTGISADEDMDAEDDGWTVVKRGTKRR